MKVKTTKNARQLMPVILISAIIALLITAIIVMGPVSVAYAEDENKLFVTAVTAEAVDKNNIGTLKESVTATFTLTDGNSYVDEPTYKYTVTNGRRENNNVIVGDLVKNQDGTYSVAGLKYGDHVKVYVDGQETQKAYFKVLNTDVKNNGFSEVSLPSDRSAERLKTGENIASWHTTGSNGYMEADTSFKPANNGKRAAELNTTERTSIYQEIATTPGTTIGWYIDAAARNVSGAPENQEFAVVIGPTLAASDSDPYKKSEANVEDIFMKIGKQGTPGYSTSGNRMSSVMYEGREYKVARLDRQIRNNRFSYDKGTYNVPEGQTETVFALASLNGNDKNDIGNLIGEVYFGENYDFAPRVEVKSIPKGVIHTGGALLQRNVTDTIDPIVFKATDDYVDLSNTERARIAVKLSNAKTGLGVTYNEADKTITISGKPASKNVTVELGSVTLTPARAKVTDAMGRLVGKYGKLRHALDSTTSGTITVVSKEEMAFTGVALKKDVRLVSEKGVHCAIDGDATLNVTDAGVITLTNGKLRAMSPSNDADAALKVQIGEFERELTGKDFTVETSIDSNGKAYPKFTLGAGKTIKQGLYTYTGEGTFTFNQYGKMRVSAGASISSTNTTGQSGSIKGIKNDSTADDSNAMAIETTNWGDIILYYGKGEATGTIVANIPFGKVNIVVPENETCIIDVEKEYVTVPANKTVTINGQKCDAGEIETTFDISRGKATLVAGKIDLNVGESIIGGSGKTIENVTDDKISIIKSEKGDEIAVNAGKSVKIDGKVYVAGDNGVTLTVDKSGNVTVKDGSVKITNGEKITAIDKEIENTGNTTIEVDKNGVITAPKGSTVKIGGEKGTEYKVTSDNATITTDGGNKLAAGSVELDNSEEISVGNTPVKNESGKPVSVKANVGAAGNPDGTATVTIPEGGSAKIGGNTIKGDKNKGMDIALDGDGNMSVTIHRPGSVTINGVVYEDTRDVADQGNDIKIVMGQDGKIKDIVKGVPKIPVTPTIDIDLTYGQKLSDIALNDGWSWSDGSIVPNVSDSGKTTYVVKIKVNDTIYDWSGIKGYADGYYTTTVEVTVKAKDITDAEVVLGETLVYNGNEQTQTVRSVTIDGLAVTYTISGNKATSVGEYTLTITADGSNFTGTVTKSWAIRQASIENVVDGGDKTKPDVIVEESGGIAPGIGLVVEKKEEVPTIIKDNAKRHEIVSTVYDITLKNNGETVQPSGKLTIKLRIPEEVDGRSFRIVHLHGTELTEVKYTIAGDYAVFTVDNLSDFAFIVDNSGSAWWLILILAILVAIEILLIVLKKRKNKKDKKKGTKLAAAMFGGVIPIYEIVLLAVLGVAAVILGAYAAYLYFPRKKSGEGNGKDNSDETAKENNNVEEEENSQAAQAIRVGKAMSAVRVGRSVFITTTKETSVIGIQDAAVNAIDEEDEVDEKEFAVAPELITEEDAALAQLYVRFNRSFTAKLILSSDETKAYFAEMANYLLSFKKVKSRMSWKNLSFNHGRVPVSKFAMRGKTLWMYLALDPKEFIETKYGGEDFSGNVRYEEVPYAVKIKSKRGLKQAKELVDILMNSLAVKRGDESNVYSAKDYPYDSQTNLVKRGLIKVYSDKKSADDEKIIGKKFDIRSNVSVSEAKNLMDDATAKKLVVAESRGTGSDSSNESKGKDCFAINIDTLSAHFEPEDTVTLTALKEKGLVPKKEQAIKILARGTLDKPLTVIADNYSADAIKMIVLTGGKAIIGNR